MNEDVVMWIRIWTLVVLLVSTFAFVLQTAKMWHTIGDRRQSLCISLTLWQVGGTVGVFGRLVESSAGLGWGLPMVWMASLATLYAVISGHVWKEEER